MKNILLILLFTSSLCFAQKDSLDRDYYTSVFSGGLTVNYRMYNSNSYGADISNHFTSGFNFEANLRVQEQLYTALGFEESMYISGGGSSVTDLYIQPSIAANIYKGNATFFGGLRGDLIIDGRFLGVGISPFVRLQYNLQGNACIGYHLGVQKFNGDKLRIGGDPAGLPPPEHFEGISLVQYIYFGVRLAK